MINQQQFFLICLFLIGFLGDVFLFPVTLDLFADGRILVLVLFWLFIVKFYRLTSGATYKVILFYLVLLFPLFIFFRDQLFFERLTTWIYVFFFIGIVHQLIEIRKEKKSV